MSRLVVAMVAFSGCLGGVEFDTDSRAYDVGAAGVDVKLILRNGNTETLAYSLCASPLERKDEAGAWSFVAEADQNCVASLQSLGPVGTATETRHLPASVGVGTFRFVTQVAVSKPETQPEFVDVRSSEIELRSR